VTIQIILVINWSITGERIGTTIVSDVGNKHDWYETFNIFYYFTKM